MLAQKTDIVHRVCQYLTIPQNWGVEQKQEEHLKQSITLCNLMNWLIIHVNTAYLLVDFYRIGNLYRSGTTFAIISFSIIALALSKYGYQFIARFLSAFIFASFVFVYGVIIKFYMSPPMLIHYLSPRIPLIMCVFFPFMFLSYRFERWAFFCTFLLNVLFVVAYDPIHYLLGINMEQFGLHLDYAHLMTQNSISFLIIISFAFIYFKMVNQQYQRQITSLYEEVQQQNEEIQAQNQALAGTQEELSTINNQLEALVQQRTQKIEEQNQQLQEYAFWNAHKLRAPVATILGLYYLLTLKEYQTEEAIEEIYIKIEKSVKDLDEVVQEIQKKIENRDTRFR
ncbi:coiled-coil domain-containing protein [Eisenibacter elegans]|uniref:coiled-coil domain-containing protein n=1 Tax=Eisenibacter elegans TaxID=997 RepID=UPI0004060044|nr:hypothetical protein [Eisenibacter elegans]